MKIDSEFPLEDCDCYLNFNKGLGRWQVCIKKSDGSRKTILYSKFLMSVKEKRILSSVEEVDHIDNDKLNDSIDNLSIVSRDENKNKFLNTLSRSMVELTCPQCLKKFTREKRQTHLSKGGIRTFCSRSCSYESMKIKNK